MLHVEISQKGQVCDDISAFSETKGIPLFYPTLPSLSGEQNKEVFESGRSTSLCAPIGCERQSYRETPPTGHHKEFHSARNPPLKFQQVLPLTV